MDNLPSGLPVPFLTRSWLVIPPVEEAALSAGFSSGADVLVLDFAALPSDIRRSAAENFAAFVNGRSGKDSDPAVFIGFPALDEATEDLLADVLAARPQGIVLMEPRAPADVQQLDVMLSGEEAIHGLPDGDIRIAALLPQALGQSYAGLSRRLIALGWSALSLQRLTGARRMHDSGGLLTDLFRQARASVLLAAVQAHVEALDTASGLFSTDRLARDCREAAADGFTGKLTLSPRQVTAINHGFIPTEEEIREAKAVLGVPNIASEPERLRALRITQRTVPSKA